MSDEIKDTLDVLPEPDATPEHSDDDNGKSEYASKDHQAYEQRYGRETVEEEMEAILEDISTESHRCYEINSAAIRVIAAVPSLRTMDDEDRLIPLAMLSQIVGSTGVAPSFESTDPIAEIMGSVKDTDSILGNLATWAGQAVVGTYKMMTYSIKRAAILIDRTKKDVDGIEVRLSKLEGLTKRRRKTDQLVFVAKEHLLLLVEDYDVNLSPSGAINTFIGACYSVIDEYVGTLRKLMSLADTELASKHEVDLSRYKDIVEQLKESLESTYGKTDTEYIGNRQLRYKSGAKISQLIEVRLGRPNPSTVVGKYRPLKALTNDNVLGQRDSFRNSVLKSMYRMVDSTVEDLEAAAKFTKLQANKSKDGEEVTESVAEVSRYLNTTIGELIEGILNMSQLAYKTVNAGVVLLEDSVSVD